MSRHLGWLVLFLTVLLSSCGGSAPTSSGAGEPGVGKYDQTWGKDYDATSCGEWLGEMNDHEHFVAAADMLINLWGVDGVEGELPADGLVDSFSGDVSEACEANSEIKVNEVGAMLYVIAKDQYGP